MIRRAVFYVATVAASLAALAGVVTSTWIPLTTALVAAAFLANLPDDPPTNR